MSNNKFFCCGMPRSRTAWLANFLTAGNSFCYHDLLKDFGSDINGYIKHLDKARPDGAEFVGDSDSGLLLFWKQVQAAFPGAPWIVIRRDANEAERSFKKHFAGCPYPGTKGIDIHATIGVCEKLLSEATIGLNNCFYTSFDSLENEGTLRSIWKWCGFDSGFPEERWKMLDGMRINIIPEKVRVK